MRTSRGNIWNDDTLCFVLGFFLNAPGIVAAGVISGNRGAMVGFCGMMFSVVLVAGGVLLKAAFSCPRRGRSEPPLDPLPLFRAFSHQEKRPALEHISI